MPVEVLSPVPYQILQQDNNGQAMVPVRLRSYDELEAGQVQFVVTPGRRGQTTDWIDLEPGGESGIYQAQVPVVAGGWYELCLKHSHQPQPEAVVHYVGVGEIFVVAGQSNAANHGQFCQRPDDGRVAAYGHNKWQPACDPLPGAVLCGS